MLSSPYQNQLGNQAPTSNDSLVRGTQEVNTQKTSNSSELAKTSGSDTNRLNSSETNPSIRANDLNSKSTVEAGKLTSDAKNPKYSQDMSIPETNVPDASPQNMSTLDDQGIKNPKPTITQPPPVNTPEKTSAMSMLASKASEVQMPQDTSSGPSRVENRTIQDSPSRETTPVETPPDNRPVPRQPFHRTPEIETPSPSGPSISTPKISSPRLAGPPQVRMPSLRIPKLR